MLLVLELSCDSRTGLHAFLAACTTKMTWQKTVQDATANGGLQESDEKMWVKTKGGRMR